MNRSRLMLFALAVGSLAASALPAQEREDRTLLSVAQMRAIINEASGERAQHHVLELVPYQRVRPASEYAGNFRESEVMVKFAKEYGFSKVEIESFATPQRLWQPTVGQLWLMGAAPRKLFDIYDTPVALASNTPTGDVTADVVDVGNGGRAEDYAGKEIKGKIVLGTAGTSALQRLGVFERGAVGVLSYNNLRPDDEVDAMMSSSIGAAPNNGESGFGWAISSRAGRDLAMRLGRGDKVTLRSVVKAETFPGEMETVHAIIPGDGSTTQEVFVSAHIYEGYIKQGANDDNSGCALTLEMGRAYIKLIKEGKLPRPKRTVNFQWLAEISGTNYWLGAHPDKAAKIIGDLNFDMEALRVGDSRSYWVLQRTPDSFPSYINDIAQSVMEYVADISRERVRFRANGYLPSQPVESARGSKDAFYIKVDKHYGSSDHVSYMQKGIPAVMFITWPDMWYHSSEDTIDKQDTTQYKRAGAVGLGALAALAGGTDELAARILQENLGRGLARMGESHTKGLGYMADVTSADQLNAAWREARVAIQHAASIEKQVVRSASILYTDVEAGKKRAAAFEPLIDKRAATLLDETAAVYQLQLSLIHI